MLYDKESDGLNFPEEDFISENPEQVIVLDLQSNENKDGSQDIALNLPWVIILSIFLVGLVSSILWQ